MSAFASAAQDRWLDLNDLRELVNQGRIAQDTAEQCMAIRRSAVNNQQHPLEFLASQQVDDLKRPGKKLDLEALTVWLAEYAGQPYLRIDPLKIDVAAVTPLMSYAFAQRHKILAVAADSERHHRQRAALRAQLGGQPHPRAQAPDQAHRRQPGGHPALHRRVLPPGQVGQWRQRRGPEDQWRRQLRTTAETGANDQEPDANDAHIVNIVDWLFQYAYQQRASDIHIEPRREQGTVRFRIDGVLHTVYQFPPQVTMAIVSRLKSLGRMNVAEKRKPQDGRVKTKTPEGGEVELRLSTLPTPSARRW